jgi:PPOX class probable F420-dependent enzyme
MRTYPQKPPLTQSELDAFLHEAPVARLGTINPDGTVHLAALWFRYEDGDIVFGTQDMSNKVRNVKLNPNVTVLVDVEEPYLRGVLIYGRAELDYEDAVAKRVAIFDKYLPHEEAQQFAARMASAFTPVVIRVRPTRLTSYDYAKDGLIEVGAADTP